jgi:hypothetical protein
MMLNQPEIQTQQGSNITTYLGLAEKRRKARTGERRRQEKMNQV